MSVELRNPFILKILWNFFKFIVICYINSHTVYIFSGNKKVVLQIPFSFKMMKRRLNSALDCGGKEL